jgi:hypothetical protein
MYCSPQAEHASFGIGGIFHSSVQRHETIQRAIEDGDPEKEQWARALVAKQGWHRQGHGLVTIQEESTHNLIPDKGLEFILNLALSSRAKVAAWYHGPFISNWIPVANTASNWSGASSGPLATELATAQFTKVDRQLAAFADAVSGVIETSSPTQITIASGVTGLTVYGTTLNSSPIVGYNSTDQVVIAATRFATPKTGLGETDILNLSSSLTASSV